MNREQKRSGAMAWGLAVGTTLALVGYVLAVGPAQWVIKKEARTDAARAMRLQNRLVAVYSLVRWTYSRSPAWLQGVFDGYLKWWRELP